MNENVNLKSNFKLPESDADSESSSGYWTVTSISIILIVLMSLIVDYVGSKDTFTFFKISLLLVALIPFLSALIALIFKRIYKKEGFKEIFGLIMTGISVIISSVFVIGEVIYLIF